jgi:hypothetical protein
LLGLESLFPTFTKISLGKVITMPARIRTFFFHIGFAPIRRAIFVEPEVLGNMAAKCDRRLSRRFSSVNLIGLLRPADADTTCERLALARVC